MDQPGTIQISNGSRKSAQFALFEGERIDEEFVHEGPFVMGTQAQIDQVKKAYKAGDLVGRENNIQ